jgi:glutamine amidotransferase
VGSAASAMSYLREQRLDQTILEIKQPFLGICLGLQIMCKFSEEGNIAGLGIFDTMVKKFPPKDKVPHMGWNNHTTVTGELFDQINAPDDFYFVHSYYAELCAETIATCDYILPFSSAFQKDNYYGVQFHPEKSAQIGNQLLANFLNL